MPPRVPVHWRKRIDYSISLGKKGKHSSPSNYIQLSTVDNNLKDKSFPIPRNRTVVFRGFLSNRTTNGVSDTSFVRNDVIKIITDARSCKIIKELNSVHYAEINWWFANSNEQYRISGQVKYFSYKAALAQAESGSSDSGANLDTFYNFSVKDQWNNLSDKAREQFYWADPFTTFAQSADQYSKSKKYDFEREDPATHDNQTATMDQGLDSTLYTLIIRMVSN